MNRLDSLKSTQSKPAQSKSAKSKSADSKADKTQTKAQTILAGALEVFTNQGYAAASMDRIAKTCGVSKPTLYTYFKSKEGLFVALIQQMTEEHHRMLVVAPDTSASTLPPDQLLQAMASLVIDKFSENRSLLTLMRLVIGESERFPELAKTFVREVKKPMLERFVAYLKTQPQLNLPDPMVAARMFAGTLVHYLLVQEIMHGKEILPLDRDRMIEGLVHQMMAGATKLE